MTTGKLLRLVVALSVLLSFFSGCGGGTTGTEVARLSGMVVGTDGNTLPNIVVTDEATGDDDDTDGAGQFLVTSGIVNGAIQVHLTGENFDVAVNIYDVPEGTTEVTVVFSVEQSDQSNTVVNIQDIRFR